MPTLIMQIIQKEPEAIKVSTPDVPAGLQGIITRLMQKKPGKRFQNGKQLYEALLKELRTLQDQHDQESYVPMQVRWTAAMGLMVGVVMLVSSIVVTNVQSKLLTDQAINNGISLATFVASETALPLLGEDWIGLEALSDEAYKRKSFDYLSIIDHTGEVRSTTDSTLTDQDWTLLAKRQEISVFDTALSGDNMYIFDAPIQFNDTTIGRVNVGIAQSQLAEVMYQTKRIMAILALSVVLAVLLIVYFFNRIIETNLLVINRSIAELKEGNYSARISRKWKREFGAMANNINTLAEILQYQSIEKSQNISTESSEKVDSLTNEVLDDESEQQESGQAVEEEEPAGEIPATDRSDVFSEFTVVQDTAEYDN
jgi:serine/threonine-protein kinase